MRPFQQAQPRTATSAEAPLHLQADTCGGWTGITYVAYNKRLLFINTVYKFVLLSSAVRPLEAITAVRPVMAIGD